MHANKRLVMELQQYRDCNFVIDGSSMIVDLAVGTWWIHGGDCDVYVARVRLITETIAC